MNIGSLFDAIYVISLPGSVQRRRSVGRTFAALGCSGYQIVDAVDGSDLDLDRMRSDATLVYCEEQDRDLMPGEVGCYLSHLEVWRRMASKGLDSMLVCEDDIVFHQDAAALFAGFMRNMPEDWDIIHFHSLRGHNAAGHGRRRISKGILEGSNESFGTLCYAIKARCVEFFLQRAFPIQRPIDGLTNWPTSDWCKDYRGYIVDPFPCRTGPFASEIGDEGSRRRRPRVVSP